MMAPRAHTVVSAPAALDRDDWRAVDSRMGDDGALDGSNADVPHASWKTNSFYDEYEVNEQAAVVAEAVKIENEVVTPELKAGAHNCSTMAEMQALMESSGAQMLSGYTFQPAPVMQPVLMQSLPWVQVPVAGFTQAPVVPAPGWGYVVAGPPSQPLSTQQDGNTTVMWRNIPNNYARDDLLELIDSEGFAGSYDFFYAPMDFTSNALVGYAFIDFVTPGEADRFFYHFQGFKKWTLMSAKVSEVSWSNPLQGLDGHIERYRNSPVMHPDVADQMRPVLLQNGQRVAFPPPTKKLRAPHPKDCRQRA